jgi:hypothetical protein
MAKNAQIDDVLVKESFRLSQTCLGGGTVAQLAKKRT